MKHIRQFLNNLKETFVGIWRNKALSSLSIISITAVLILFGIVLLLVLNMTKVIVETGDKVDSVVVYLTDEANDEQINAIIATAEKTKNIESVYFVSEQEAVEKFKKSLDIEANDEYIFDILEEFPLPRSVEFKVKDVETSDEVVAAIKDLDGVDVVEYPNELIGKIVQMTQWVKILGVIVVGTLLVIAIILIHNTIKATLTNRQREIEIMQYVGATRGYIVRPFLMEGIFFGLIASALAVVIVYFGYELIYMSVEHKFSTLLGMHFVSPEGVLREMSIIFGCLGIGIGYLGSALSMKRFLDV